MKNHGHEAPLDPSDIVLTEVATVAFCEISQKPKQAGELLQM